MVQLRSDGSRAAFLRPGSRRSEHSGDWVGFHVRRCWPSLGSPSRLFGLAQSLPVHFVSEELGGKVVPGAGIEPATRDSHCRREAVWCGDLRRDQGLGQRVDPSGRMRLYRAAANRGKARAYGPRARVHPCMRWGQRARLGGSNPLLAIRGS